MAHFSSIQPNLERFLLGTVLASCTLGFLPQDPAMGQLIPDGSLGTERSRVQAIDGLNDRIKGGADRGANLFHSFREFNVGEGRGVFFSNPTGINNILTRVTGNNPSNIFGRLGVSGNANLFLLNPSGIVFGPNASLDVQGSFLATTASSIALGDQAVFSAANPEESQLLSITPGALFFHEATNQPGSITNLGTLAAGKDLTLAADNLDLQNQLIAGQDLNLLAKDTVKIRDSEANPFIAAAGNQLLLQGNQTVDIFALNHPESGLFSRGDMVLRSEADVIGDIHFSSGGSFEVQKLDGQLGNLFSFYDPVIRSEGDVRFFGYEGTSLHILAGGSVDINTVTITGPDTVGDSINPTATPDLANVTLSDGTSIVINGNERSTLDVRAGVEPSTINNPLGTTGANASVDRFFDSTFSVVPSPTNNSVATGADITIENIINSSPNGLVLLTNQYQSNSSLSGDIIVGSVDLSNNLQGGSIILDSKNQINVEGLINTSGGDLSTSDFSGNGGDITFLAAKNIVANSGPSILTYGLLGGNIDLVSDNEISLSGSIIQSINFSSTPNITGGNISIISPSITLLGGAQIFLATLGSANTGDFKVSAKNKVLIKGENLNLTNNNSSGIFNLTFGDGNAGDLEVRANSISITEGAQLASRSFGEGASGKVKILAHADIFLDGERKDGFVSNIVSTVDITGKGRSGGIDISADSLTASNGGQINVSNFGQGTAGNLVINTQSLSLTGESSILLRPTGLFSNIGGLSSSDGTLITDPLDIGDSGNITINTQNLLIAKGAIVRADTFGRGDSGDVTINAKSIEVDGVASEGQPSRITASVTSSATGNGGNLKISTDSLKVLDGASVSVSTSGNGNSGNLTLNSKSIEVIGTSKDKSLNSRLTTQVNSSAIGNGGNLSIDTTILNVLDGASISASTFGKGDSGNLAINAQHINVSGISSEIADISDVFLSNITSEVRPSAIGNGGDIEIISNSLQVLDGAFISASTFGQGNSGNLAINAQSIEVSGISRDIFPSNLTSEVKSLAVGDGGNIAIDTNTLKILDDAFISTSTDSRGLAGNILVNNAKEVLLDKSTISSAVQSNGQKNGGEIEIRSDQLLLKNKSNVNASTASSSQAGNITINTNRLDVNSGSQILASTSSSGDAGNINIFVRDDISITGRNSGFFADSAPNSSGNAGNIFIDPIQVELRDGAKIIASSQGSGKGGNIELFAGTLILDNQSEISASSFGVGNAGDISLNIDELLSSIDSEITTAASTASGGAIDISAQNIRLFGDSDIRTNVASGANSGGDITLNADNIIAFGDSDVLAFSQDGRGGDINLNTPIFLGEDFSFTPVGDVEALDGNGRVDINASGAISSGAVTLPDVSFIEESLTELPDNPVDTSKILANSCIVRTNTQQGNFVVTGAGGLQERPGGRSGLPFPTGTVRSVTENNEPTSASAPQSWQMGDPISEPDQVYQLSDGQLVMSRACS